MKKTVTWLIIIILAAISAYNYHLKESFESELLHTKAVMDSTVQVAQQQYMTQTVESEKLRYDNAKLRQTIDNLRSKERAYLKLIAEYRTRMDTIHTVDTVYIDSSNGLTYHERRFDMWVVPDELRFRGRFQTQEPYQLFIDELYLRLSPEIVLAQNREGVWSAVVDTHSDLLKVNDINLQVRPYKQPIFDLKPKVYFWYAMGFPHNELGLTAMVRIWKIQPFGLLSTQRIQIGIRSRIW